MIDTWITFCLRFSKLILQKFISYKFLTISQVLYQTLAQESQSEDFKNNFKTKSDGLHDMLLIIILVQMIKWISMLLNLFGLQSPNHMLVVL